MQRCLLGVGANQGDCQKTIDEALAALANLPSTDVVAVSQLVESSPVGGPAGQAPYLNGAAVLETRLPPPQLLVHLHAIERVLGRSRVERWGTRTIDLDLLLYEQQVVLSPATQVPHPRMSFRPFVMAPAAEVAGDWPHPLLGSTINQLWERLQHGEDAVVVYGRSDSTAKDFCVELSAKYPALRQVETPLPGADALPRSHIALVLDGALVNRLETCKLAVFLGPIGPAPVAGWPTLMLAPQRQADWRWEAEAAIEAVWPRLGRPTGDG